MLWIDVVVWGGVVLRVCSLSLVYLLTLLFTFLFVDFGFFFLSFVFIYSYLDSLSMMCLLIPLSWTWLCTLMSGLNSRKKIKRHTPPFSWPLSLFFSHLSYLGYQSVCCNLLGYRYTKHGPYYIHTYDLHLLRLYCTCRYVELFHHRLVRSCCSPIHTYILFFVLLTSCAFYFWCYVHSKIFFLSHFHGHLFVLGAE